MDDTSYKNIFNPIIDKIMERYKPEAVVLQCGADSLAHDRLGKFNLTLQGHANCVKKLKSFNVPLLLLGGGGYTTKNVARCWAFETGVALGVDEDMSNDIPINDFASFFGPHYFLHINPIRDLPNRNTPADIERVLHACLDNLEKMPVIAPSAVRYPGNPEDPSYEEISVPGMSESSAAPTKSSVKLSRKRRGSDAGTPHK